MDDSGKKSIKLTTNMQFQKLVNCMEEYPHLATGCPQFGSTKCAYEQGWEKVAKRVNAYGPPARNGNEWKKVWADQKCRLKKKIAENNKNLNETGGGPCRVVSLTKLENDIDRICTISSAAAPNGKIFGLPPKKIVTPPRSSQKVAVVTPNSSNSLSKSTQPEILPQGWIALETQEKYPPKKCEVFEPCRLKASECSATKEKSFNRKRNHSEKSGDSEERIKLLRQQAHLQSETLTAMKKQAEVAKECALAVKQCTEVLKAQSESLKTMAECKKLMTKGLFDIVKHLTEE